MDKRCIEWEMGFSQKFMVKRKGVNWVCEYSSDCHKLRFDKPGSWYHAINHVVKEIKNILAVIKGFPLDTQIEQLKDQYSKEQLDILLARVERGSQLEKAILRARDYIVD